MNKYYEIGGNIMNKQFIYECLLNIIDENNIKIDKNESDDEKNIKFSIKLQTDEKFEDMLSASLKSGNPLKLVGDRIIELKVEEKIFVKKRDKIINEVLAN